MIKSVLKHVSSALLAFLMFISLFTVPQIPVNAAAETANVVAIAFPRRDDANYSTTAWGHGDMTFTGGWRSDAKKYFSVFAMDSWTGNICYCIELGVHISQGDSFTKRDENFWNNFPSNLNSVITPDDIKVIIGRILQYGYTGTVSSGWRSQNEADANKMAHAIATQLLIWETVIGERDRDFNHIAPSGCSAVLDMIRADHPLRTKILSYYKSIENSVLNHTKVPSFMSRSSGKAQTMEFRWNGKEYEAVLTDTNNVLGNYTYSSDTAGIRFNVSGNTLTVTADSVADKPVTITAEKNNAKRKGLIVWSDGVISQSGGKQDTVTFAQEVTDPVKGFLYLKASCGSAKIVKTSEDGKVDGITFRIQGNGVDKTVKTENDGQIQVDNLMPGVYTVTEQEYDRYEPQETRRVTVVAGQVATVNFNNTLKRGDVQVIKSSEDNFNEGVTFHLYGTSLSGIAKNPVENVTIPKEEHAKREIWTVEDFQKALANCDDDNLSLALNLAFSCTLRIGEMLGITLDCIDVSDKSIEEGKSSIYINKELQRVNREILQTLDKKDVLFIFPHTLSNSHTVLVLKKPKTDTSERRVYLPKTVALMVREKIKSIEEIKELFGDEYTDYNLLFAHSSGRPIEGQVINRAMKKLIKENDLPDVVFHSVRHSSITYKLKWTGGDIKAVQGDSGHARAEMVQDVYSHILDEDRRTNARRFDENFYQQKPEEAKEEVPQTETQNKVGVDPTTLFQLLADPEMAKAFQNLLTIYQSKAANDK